MIFALLKHIMIQINLKIANNAILHVQNVQGLIIINVQDVNLKIAQNFICIIMNVWLLVHPVKR
jgi:hypothetical protein